MVPTALDVDPPRRDLRSSCVDHAAGRLLVALALAAFAVVLLNALGLFADLHFVLPVAPAFLLLGLAGLLGERLPRDTRTLARTT